MFEITGALCLLAVGLIPFATGTNTVGFNAGLKFFANSGTSLTNFVHIWSGTSGGLLVPVASTNYLSPCNTSSNLTLFTADTAGATRCPVTRAMTIQNLYVVWTPAPGSGKTNFLAVTTNGQPSSIAIQIIGTATNGNDVAHSVTVAAGAEIGVRLATQSSAVAGKVAWGFEGR